MDACPSTVEDEQMIPSLPKSIKIRWSSQKSYTSRLGRRMESIQSQGLFILQRIYVPKNQSPI